MNYRDVGAIAQAMKHQVRNGGGWEDLSPAEREAIDQILSSIARTVSSGQGVHWNGIVAYAESAKPGTDDPNAAPSPAPRRPGHLFDEPEPRAQRAGIEAIERSMRSIPAKDQP